MRPGPEFLSCSQQMSACGVGRAAPLVRNRDLYPDFNISLPSQLVWSSDISWTKPLRQSLWRRERKSYIYNWQISLHGKTVPTFCDCWPGSGLGRVIPMGQAALSRPVLEVLPCGSPVRMTPAIWALCHGRAHQCLLTRWALGEPDLRSFLAMPAVSHGAVLDTWGFAPPLARCGQHCLARGGGASTWLLAA